MVGRFALTSPPAVWRDYFGYADEPDFPPRPAIAPTEPIAVVIARDFSHGAELRFRLMRWGFLPGFAKDPATFPLLINARAETLLERPSFRAAFKRRRCLIPADGYFVRRDKQTHIVQAADRGPLALAGLYETYLDASGGEIDTACLITTASPAALGDRRPVLIPRAALRDWLDHEAPLDAAVALLAAAPEQPLQTRPV